MLVRSKEFEAFRKEVRAFEKLMRAEFAGVEEGISIKAEACERPAEMISREVQDKLIRAVAACPDGLQRHVAGDAGAGADLDQSGACRFGRPQRAAAMPAAQFGQFREGGAGDAIAAVFELRAPRWS